MTFDEYQAEAYKTAIYNPKYKVMYPAIGLQGEIGEFCNRIQKVIRDKDCQFTEDDKAYVAAEMGGALWFLAALASDLDISLDAVAAYNIKSLRSRAERGTLGGSGNER